MIFMEQLPITKNKNAALGQNMRVAYQEKVSKKKQSIETKKKQKSPINFCSDGGGIFN